MLIALAMITALVCGPALARPGRGGDTTTGVRLPGAPRCPVFPADNPFNQRVDRLPTAHGSAALIARIGLGDPVHPDFGSGLYNGAPIGIPYAVVSKHTRRVPVSFQYASESDGHRYPLPRHVAIEGGPSSTGDRHVIVVDRDSCRDYELFAAYPHNGGRHWTAGSGAIFNLRSTTCAPPPTRPPTPRGCRSCPGWPATTKSLAARSTTRCGSPHRARLRDTCIPPGTSPPPAAARRCRRWASGCG